MQLSANGYKIPEDGDRGSAFWDYLEFNWDRIDGHTHDGTDSEQLTPAALAGQTQAIDASAWTSVGGGLYRRLITMPGALEFDDVSLRVRITNGTDSGHQIVPTILKASANTFYIYVNDNTLTLLVIYR